VPRHDYRIGVPRGGYYAELLNTDSGEFWGSNVGNAGGKHADHWKCHGREWSLSLTLPPLGALILKPVYTQGGDRPMVGRSPSDSVQFLLLLLMRKELRNLLQAYARHRIHQEAVSSLFFAFSRFSSPLNEVLMMIGSVLNCSSDLSDRDKRHAVISGISKSVTTSWTYSVNRLVSQFGLGLMNRFQGLFAVIATQ
jgi:hypothetical protein